MIDLSKLKLTDEGYIDEDEASSSLQAGTSAVLGSSTTARSLVAASVPRSSWVHSLAIKDKEELVYKLLASMPRSQMAKVHRRIAPFLQFDVVGLLPTELSLQIFSHLSWQTLLQCALVSKRWRTLADDQSLWKHHCAIRGWEWRQPTLRRGDPFSPLKNSAFREQDEDFDDEGMGDEDDDDLFEVEDYNHDGPTTPPWKTTLEQQMGPSQHTDNNFSEVIGLPPTPRLGVRSGASSSVFAKQQQQSRNRRSRSKSRNAISRSLGGSLNLGNSGSIRFSAPAILPTAEHHKPDYKLLHQTHRLLHNRMLHGKYRFSTLQTRGTPESHLSAIYCLQLYTYHGSSNPKAPESVKQGQQVLFTGAKDATIREWNLTTGVVERVFSGNHEGSVLSLCAGSGYLASGGSDWRVCVWDLTPGAVEGDVKLVRAINDHRDSVLCVRLNERMLVSCSKDRSIRTYLLPDLRPGKTLSGHRAAVNAIALSEGLIISASGDKSIRLWDAYSGVLLRTFEGHHARGIASIDFQHPFVLSGSSDKHIRLFDVTTRHGWSTAPEFHNLPAVTAAAICEACGGHLHDSNADPLGRSNVHGANTTSLNTLRRYQPIGPANWRSSVSMARAVHTDLVRSVALGRDFAVTGSYDLSIKVWDRETGTLVADLQGGHEGRIFCVGFDCTKIVSCGEDQKICIWDFSCGIDTSFLRL